VRTRWLLAVFAGALLLAACGGGNGSEDSASNGSGGSQMDHGMNSTEGDKTIDFGRPGKPADANRKIEIEALDSLEFEPSGIEVEQGETVTFAVTNAGKNAHEFTLGDEDFQLAHQEEMKADEMGGDEPSSLVLEPGDTKELTWTFTETGEVLYGCHEPGHYEGGMVGTVTVG
jgi:uncharacterized cupredoxin-like copper-binding protein